MKSKERLVIKNFGPIVEADIEIKPFMVFIGESGSGKSMILKLLSLFRWIYKQQQQFLLMEILIKNQPIFEAHLNKTLKVELENSGLIDYCQKGSFASYEIDGTLFTIQYNTKLQFTLSHKQNNKLALLEKISFITEERLIIPTLLNNKSRNIVLPYHLTSTYEDFRFAFDRLKNANKQVTINTVGINLNSKKSAYDEKFFISQNNASYKVNFQNSSSGIKSASIVEVISHFYPFFYPSYYENDMIANSFIKIFLKSTNLNSHWDTAKIAENIQNIALASNKFETKDTRISIFIEEPELNLFPNAQKAMVEQLVYSCFEPPKLDKHKTINIAFSTHSPYMLSSLNCLLLAYEVGKKSHLKEETEKIIPKNFWLDISKFNAFKVENGKVESIIDKETNLILADKIDEVSEEIATIFDNLLDLQYK